MVRVSVRVRDRVRGVIVKVGIGLWLGFRVEI